MAVVQNPIIGKARQKFGNAIFQNWKGLNVLRTKPLEVKNPQSTRQTEQRVQFTNTQNFSRSILGLIKIGLRGLAIGKSEFNVFISENIKFFNNTSTGDIVTTPLNLVVSKGTLEKLTDVTATAAGFNVNVAWDGSGAGNPTDQIYVLYFNKITAETLVIASGATRSTGSLVIASPWTNLGASIVSIFAGNIAGQVSDNVNVAVS